MSTTVDTVKDKLKEIKNLLASSLQKRALIEKGTPRKIPITDYSGLFLPKTNDKNEIISPADPKYKEKESKIFEDILKALQFKVKDDGTFAWEQATIEEIKAQLQTFKDRVNNAGKQPPPQLERGGINNIVDNEVREYENYVLATVYNILDSISGGGDIDALIEEFQSMEKWIEQNKKNRQEVLVFLQSIIPIN